MKIVEVRLTVGVPQMVPLLLPKLSPFGMLGQMFHESTAPPEFEKVIGVIAWFLVSVVLDCEATRFDNGSLIVIVMVVLSLPPLLLAQIVNTVCVRLTVGVPEIMPFADKSNPFGRPGDISKDAISPPLSVGMIEVII